jgi:single-strand DNA-binding protein
MNYVFEGTVKILEELKEFESGFKKREIVISSLDEKFQQDIKFEFLKDTADKLEGIKTGDLVKVSFNLRGNEYNGKYYNNLVGFHIAKVTQGDKSEPSTTLPPVSTPSPAMAQADDDNLPF